MITVYLQGGLGNQLFQVAATYNHALKNKDVAKFDFTNSHTPHQGNNSSKYINTIFKEFDNFKNIYDICNVTFTQPGHSFCEIPYVKNQQLQGFFQSEKFFIENKELIKNKILNGINSYSTEVKTVKEELDTIRKTHNKPIVAVHIRRGDYLKFLGIHDPSPVGYYNKALLKMQDIIGDFFPYFISDDMDWCKETFKDVGGKFSIYNDEICDILIMINSDHNIIANSSFSWWGAYLNPNEDKVTIAPNRWFGVNGPKDQQDIIPEKWIKI